MKKIMKKALSLVLVLAMTLVPMTSWAAPVQAVDPVSGTGTADDPYVINADETAYGITVAANSQVYVQTSAGATVKGLGAYNGAFSLMESKFAYPVSSDGSTEISMEVTSETGMFILVNDVEDAANRILISASASSGSGSGGLTSNTVDTAKEVKFADLYGWGELMIEDKITLAAGNDGYFYKMVAPDDGAISVSVYTAVPNTNGMKSLDYLFYVNNGDFIYSNDNDTEEFVEVKKGDELMVFIVPLDFSSYSNTNPEAEVTLYANFYAPGSLYYPEEIEEGSYTATVGQYGSYVYTFTAPSKGEVTVTVDENATNWRYTVGDGSTHKSTDETIQSSETVTVAKDEVVKITFGTANYASGSVLWKLDFEADATAGGEEDEEPAGTIEEPANLVLGTNADEIAEGNFMYYYTWTAPGKGTFTVYGNELQSPDGYGYVVMVNDENVGSGSSANTTDEHQDKTEIHVEKDQVVEVRVYRPDFSAGKFAIQAEFANYAISDTVLAVKENSVTLDQNHEYTIYAFEATEDGNYTISTTGTTIGNWGAFDWNLNDPNATTNTITMDITKGQTFYFGVPSDKDSCTVTITYNGNIENDGQTYTAYVNKVTPEAYTFDGEEENLIYIDVTDDVEDVIVLGKDGFYHYGTENGPVVLVDLANETFSLSANVGTAEKPGPSPVKDTINMVDYTEAMLEYVTAADKTTSLYPLTEDLMAVYKNVGIARGWYEASGYGYNLFDGKEMDPEKAWMFTCCYVYEVVDGDGAAWTQGSEEGLTIKANGPFNEFVRLEIDGKEVDKANYTVKEGSTIVILSEDYLATLSVGTHTVTFVYENNGFEYTAETAITIATPDGTTTDTPGTPGTVAPGGTTTGDATNIALWVAILGLGVVAIAGSVVMKKREF